MGNHHRWISQGNVVFRAAYEWVSTQTVALEHQMYVVQTK